MANRPTATTTVSMPSSSSSTPMVNRACPVCRSMPTRPSARPMNRLARPRTRLSPSTAVTVVSARTISAKYSAGPNSRASLTSCGATKLKASGGDGAGDERADGGGGQRLGAAALARHHVAVDGGDDRARFARRVEQDRGGRAAIHGAVVDAAEHDEGGGGIELGGDRQEQRHGERRADARQHADGGADRDAQRRPEQVHRRQRHGEAVAECRQRFHGQRFLTRLLRRWRAAALRWSCRWAGSGPARS